MSGKSKKKFRIIMSSLLSLLLILGVAANIALYYYSDVITAYFSEIDLESPEAVEARNNSTEVVELIADEGIILLQNNEDFLPVDATNDNDVKVNVFGWSFTNPIYGGTGSGESDASSAVTPRAGFEAAGLVINEQLYNDYVDTGIERPLVMMDGQDWSIPEPKPEEFYTTERMEQAKEFSDTAVIFIARSGGEGADLPRSMDGPDTFDPTEGFSGAGQKFGHEDDLDANKHYLELTNREQGMIDAVTENFDKVVLVVNVSNTFELGWVQDYSQIKSVINVAGPGQNGFASLGKIIAGDVNPSGRTVNVFATDLLDAPAMRSYGDLDYVLDNGDETYSQAVDAEGVPLKYIDYVEGIYLGYRYYETAAIEGALDYDEKVIYPFGYGLSYTSFEQEVVPDSLSWGEETISFDVNVTNTGSVAGKEVVQIYFSAPYTGNIERSAVDLAAFDKTDIIEPGNSETVTITFEIEDMAAFDYDKVYSESGAYVLEAGQYELYLMHNSHEKIADIGSENLSLVVFEDGRSTDEQIPVNQFDDLVTGEGSLTTYLSRANGFENLEEIDTTETYTVTTDEGTKEVEGKLIGAEFVNTINSMRYDVPAETYDEAPVTGANNNKDLNDYIGVDYNDASWEELLDQLTVEDLVDLTTLGGYRTVEINSVGKPATLDYDGPAAINNMNMAAEGQSGIAFPTEVMIASTWNLELAEAMGSHVAAEAVAYGVTGWYAPGVNIHRTAFSGRNFEYYSEDAFLSGKMGAAVTNGFQSHGGYVYIKHYALNDQETNRTLGVLTWANEQTIRENYLKPFEIAVKEGEAAGVMSSFNSIGHTWAGASSGLLNEVLRNEWGFTGMVITDFYMINSYPYMIYDLGIRNGNDLYLTGAAPHGAPEVNTESNDTLWAMRDASKNILYTVANSNGMENIMSSVMPTWIKVTIVVDILLVLGIVAGFYFIFRKRNKAGNVEVNASTI
ncbi:glycoside hydrolase family 3 N-terminal domain-containing protein [Amphibacillus cookii]|uniref:glycoside hydrolase family 3 N-terminal domain-containing protein n=1 Tax=Amphibacillus cookii TaxID=767787 RepID=UPI001957948B|nr:glycoside hydrolase family 3 N-terminal domain-containing protein [Amphibacillus cookii]MBM7541086.1 beta-glucosidase [Amphibacillus cookii]